MVARYSFLFIKHTMLFSLAPKVTKITSDTMLYMFNQSTTVAEREDLDCDFKFR